MKIGYRSPTMIKYHFEQHEKLIKKSNLNGVHTVNDPYNIFYYSITKLQLIGTIYTFRESVRM